MKRKKVSKINFVTDCSVRIRNFLFEVVSCSRVKKSHSLLYFTFNFESSSIYDCRLWFSDDFFIDLQTSFFSESLCAFFLWNMWNLCSSEWKNLCPFRLIKIMIFYTSNIKIKRRYLNFNSYGHILIYIYFVILKYKLKKKNKIK